MGRQKQIPQLIINPLIFSQTYNNIKNHKNQRVYEKIINFLKGFVIIHTPTEKTEKK